MTLPSLLLCAALAARIPGDYFEQGMIHARQERWNEARAAFEQGRRFAPRDPRFPVELAGVAFKQRRFGAAKRHLREALDLAPSDAYANDFLASLYQLEGNTEAALKYWNRSGKPRIGEIRMEPRPGVDAFLLDRAFAFAPASVVTLEDYFATRARLDFLESFPRYRLDLEAGPESGFNAVFRSGGRRSALASLFRGLPFQAIAPGFSTAAGVNVDSMFRWDKQKRRAMAAISGPLARGATARYRFFADGRNENWITSGLNLRKLEAGAELRILLGSRWDWSTAVIASTRDYPNLDSAGPLFAGGELLKYRGSLSGRLWSVPEARFHLTGSASLESGRLFEARSAFTKAALGLGARWSPRRDYEVTARARAGHISGSAPFDELFLLGVERDTDLWMRARPGTRDGKKGSSPLGHRYALFNVEADRVLYRGAFFTIRGGPLVDIGAAPGDFGSGIWLFDTGAQAKVEIFGAAFALSYGRDLRGRRNAYYATWGR